MNVSAIGSNPYAPKAETAGSVAYTPRPETAGALAFSAGATPANSNGGSTFNAIA